jgi:hypothetical protein
MIEYLATCTNKDCPNKGVPSLVYSEDGSVPSVLCGPCGDTPITDIKPKP